MLVCLLLRPCALQKAAALRQAKDVEVERDAALAEVLTWRRRHEELDQQLQVPAVADRCLTC